MFFVKGIGHVSNTFGQTCAEAILYKMINSRKTVPIQNSLQRKESEIDT